jgi:tetratricopeptide (TPR) repeat protein
VRSNRALSAAAGWLVPAACLIASVLLVARTRPGLAEAFHRLRAEHDVYVLPPPEQTVVMSLGYRAALADLIYGHVLVSYGLHFQEKRLFEFVGHYLDTINALDPKFRDPYRFADTLLTLQPKKPPLEHYRKAREILLRGMRELPYDQELWLTAGQFMAYLAPPHIPDPKEKEEFRMDGARRLARACELVGDNSNAPYHCVTAAGLFSRAGDREATLRFLERVLAVSDDAHIRELALGYLKKLVGEREQERLAERYQKLEALRKKDHGFVPRDMLMVLGPPFDPSRCAGEYGAERPGCASSYRSFGEALAESDVESGLD